MITFDTETCGFHGPVVLIQWARDAEKPRLHSVFTSPIGDTLEVWDTIIRDKVLGFNLTFDVFHLNKSYNTLMFLGREVGFDKWPIDYVNEMACIESRARDGFCLKPQGALDLFLHARKTEYQTSMDRGDIRIRRIPHVLAYKLIAELNTRIELPDILFARYADKKRRWEVQAVTNDLGEVNPDLCDIYLRFAPSSALKAIIADAQLSDDIITFGEFSDLPSPSEQGFAPFATAPFYKDKVLYEPRPGRWHMRWPEVIRHHVDHWAYDPRARQYAEDDVTYTRRLWEFFDQPAFDDDDSMLACAVGAIRWKGLRIDAEYIAELKESVQEQLRAVEFNFNSPKACALYIGELLSETERAVLTTGEGITTKGAVLEELAKRKVQTVCNECYGSGEGKSENESYESVAYENESVAYGNGENVACRDCGGTGLVDTDQPHPVSARARYLLDARHAAKEVELYDKLLLAGRFHASYKIIGALSGRMSGGDGLNPQGIKRDKRVRAGFPLAWKNMILGGGDFDSFEVSIADAAWPDHRIHAMLSEGKKFHGIFGVYLFPGHTYDQIVATQELDGQANLYSRSKQGVFAMLYGGDENTLANRVGIDDDAAVTAFREFMRDFPELAKARQAVADSVMCLQQPGGIGSKVEWMEPVDYVASLLGFRRFYTLENQICKALYGLANKVPKDWRLVKQTVIRRDREQTASGAISSALYGAAFAIASSSSRSAGNHVIQSTGAAITKRMQAALWELQPSGISPWVIMPTNFHDEVMAPMIPAVQERAEQVVKDIIALYRPVVPLIEMTWKSGLENWSKK